MYYSSGYIIYSIYIILDESLTAYVETDIIGKPTIRHTACPVLIEEGKRCSSCKEYRKSLHAMTSRYMTTQLNENRTAADSHVNYRYLTSSEKNERLSRLHQINKAAKRRITILENKIEEISNSVGESVDKQTHQDLLTILQENEEYQRKLPAGSFKELFWNQQLKAGLSRSHSAMRWHPLMIKWCIYLRHLSSGCYEALRQSGCITLPSQRTLRDYTHFAKATMGFSVDVDLQLIEAAEASNCPEWKKCVVILMDEMYIRESLVYEKSSGIDDYSFYH